MSRNQDVITLTGVEYDDLMERANKFEASEMNEDNIFSLELSDLADVPEDLLDEMTVLGPALKKDMQIIDLLKLADRPLTVDELLISLWRKFNVKMKRNMLVSKMHRLKKKGIVSAAGKGKYKSN